MSSRISGFHKLPVAERRARLAELAGLSEAQLDVLAQFGALGEDTAERMIENTIGAISIPIGLATNMIVDGEDVLVPMATEESSVVAAVCNAARQNRDSGGFVTSVSPPYMIAQIQILALTDVYGARLAVLEREADVRAICDAVDPVLVKLGGGFRELEARIVDTAGGPILVVHIIADTRDAMGANAVNTMAETLAPHLAEWTGGRALLRILSNLADRRLARARAVWTPAAIGGEQVRDDMVAAFQFADADPYRAATHNKGIMNGVTAVVLATGNDTRAVEAGAHAFAARSGRYRSLSQWGIDGQGNLVGSLEMPLAVGLIGGATRIHPTARAALDIMDVATAERLQRIIAAIGLAQNFSAMKALATTGIQKGHMALHAQNIAIMAGASGDEIGHVAAAMVARGSVRVDVAEELLAELRKG